MRVVSPTRCNLSKDKRLFLEPPRHVRTWGWKIIKCGRRRHRRCQLDTHPPRLYICIEREKKTSTPANAPCCWRFCEQQMRVKLMLLAKVCCCSDSPKTRVIVSGAAQSMNHIMPGGCCTHSYPRRVACTLNGAGVRMWGTRTPSGSKGAKHRWQSIRLFPGITRASAGTSCC